MTAPFSNLARLHRALLRKSRRHTLLELLRAVGATSAEIYDEVQ